MPKKRNSLIIQREVGGPEEDRTPDLLIANDTITRDINRLHACCGAKSSTKAWGGCTDWAQGMLPRIWEFLHFVWRENLAGARISVRDAWELAGYTSGSASEVKS